MVFLRSYIFQGFFTLPFYAIHRNALIRQSSAPGKYNTFFPVCRQKYMQNFLTVFVKKHKKSWSDNQDREYL